MAAGKNRLKPLIAVVDKAVQMADDEKPKQVTTRLSGEIKKALTASDESDKE